MRRILMERCLSSVLVGSMMLLSPVLLPAQSGAPAAKADDGAVHVLGLEVVKRNTKGQINVEAGTLRFDAKASHAEVPLSSIKNFDWGEQSKQTGGKVGTVAKMTVPYGGGRALSLIMRAKVDVVTLEYQDGNGALHGVILSLPRGQGAELQSKLTAQGAHLDTAQAASKGRAAASASSALAPAPDKAKGKRKITASAIQVEPVETGEMDLPADFRMAIYENLIEEVRKTGNFKEVYRSGDRRAAGVPDLITLHATLVKFKEGSQTERQVTTVAGATNVEVRTTVTGHDGRSLLDQQVEGNVRFFGDNLRATSDLAKRIAKLFGSTV